MNRSAPIIAGTLVMLFLGAYMGSYYVMLVEKANIPSDDGRAVYVASPIYRGDLADHSEFQARHMIVRILRPAHCVDRLARGAYWAESSMEYDWE